MCYRLRIISEIRSNYEFSCREMETPAIRMNTKMLNAFLLFSRKRNNEMSWNFHRLVLLHISWFLVSMEACTDTLPMLCMGFKTRMMFQWPVKSLLWSWFCPPFNFFFSFSNLVWSRVKDIKSAYVDTTFCVPEAMFIPSRVRQFDYHIWLCCTRR